MLIRFSQIIEQNKAKEMLRRAVIGGKLAHAYLFRGTTGVGKQSLAHALAAALNCHNLPVTGQHSESSADLEACGTCPSCRKFAAGSHPDLLVVEPDGQAIKIQQVRELKKALAFPPLEARLRVVLLSEVHNMRREAANSLLKTLEEPPAETIFILTGDEAGGILPTILSRCQIIPFFPLSVEGVAAILARETAIDPGAAATLAAVAEGSLTRARLWQKKELLPLREEVLTMLVDHRLEQPEAVEAVLAAAERCALLKEDLEDLLDLLATCFHDLALLASSPSDPAPGQVRPRINQDLSPLLERAQSRWNFQQLGERLEHLRRAKRQLARNCNRGLVCEVLFFDLL